LVDTAGLLVIVVVHTASIQDRDRAKLVLEQVKDSFPLLKLCTIWADAGFSGQLVDWVSLVCGWILEVLSLIFVKIRIEIQAIVILRKLVAFLCSSTESGL
jgi:hypothetical protein